MEWARHLLGAAPEFQMLSLVLIPVQHPVHMPGIVFYLIGSLSWRSIDFTVLQNHDQRW